MLHPNTQQRSTLLWAFVLAEFQLFLLAPESAAKSVLNPRKHSPSLPRIPLGTSGLKLNSPVGKEDLSKSRKVLSKVTTVISDVTVTSTTSLPTSAILSSTLTLKQTESTPRKPTGRLYAPTIITPKYQEFYITSNNSVSSTISPKASTENMLTSHKNGEREESVTSHSGPAAVHSGNAESHLTSADTDNSNHRVSPLQASGDPCVGNRCGGRSRCDASEGVIPDTGLTYMCRCPKHYYGIFCNIHREVACGECVGAGLHCYRTNMHFSAHYCYNTTNPNWPRVQIGRCGGRNMTCDGGRTCVRPVSICDGVTDCRDGRDELPTYCQLNTPDGSTEP